jgi:hypothetical protein
VAIAVGCLFLSAYAFALGDPMPRSIDAALVGNGPAHPQILADVQRVAGAVSSSATTCLARRPFARSTCSRSTPRSI